MVRSQIDWVLDTEVRKEREREGRERGREEGEGGGREGSHQAVGARKSPGKVQGSDDWFSK